MKFTFFLFFFWPFIASHSHVWFTANKQRYLLTSPAFSKQLCGFILSSSFLHNRQAKGLVWWEAAARLDSQLSISNEVPISPKLKVCQTPSAWVNISCVFQLSSLNLSSFFEPESAEGLKNVWSSYHPSHYQFTVEGLGTFENPS